MTEIENTTKDLKFYSKRAIGIATFIGGPLAAGYLISENYKALNKPDEGKKALIIGIVSTIIIFGIIFMLPEKIIDDIPHYLIPMMTVAITYFIVEKIHGEILNKHADNNNEFFSAWKAAGVGLISLIIMLVVILAFVFLEPDNSAQYELYDNELSVFYENEDETLVFYDQLGIESRLSLLGELETITIPKWKENIEIVKKASEIPDLPPELAQHNATLLKYAQLRLKGFELFKKAVNEDTDKYQQEIERVHQEIEVTLNKLE